MIYLKGIRIRKYLTDLTQSTIFVLPKDIGRTKILVGAKRELLTEVTQRQTICAARVGGDPERMSQAQAPHPSNLVPYANQRPVCARALRQFDIDEEILKLDGFPAHPKGLEMVPRLHRPHLQTARRLIGIQPD